MINKFLLTILVVLISVESDFCFGQYVEIDTFKLKGNSKTLLMPWEQMNFPVIRTKNSQKNAAINNDIFFRFTNRKRKNKSLKVDLENWIEDIISYFYFETTLNKSGLLSFNMSAEGCGAHCSNWTDYFNYDTQTGEWLNISKIIDTTGSFRNRVYRDVALAFRHEKKILKQGLNDPVYPIDKTSYEWALEYYNSCEKAFSLKEFSLQSDRICIIVPCDLPYAIRCYEPYISLNYNFTEIDSFLQGKLKAHVLNKNYYKDFEPSSEYYLTPVDSAQVQKFWNNYNSGKTPQPISLYLKDERGKTIYKFKEDQLEFYSGTTLSVLEVKHLDGIKKVIRLVSEYDACYTDYFVNYFLVTDNDSLIQLPVINYTLFDYRSKIREYRFPNQKFGLPNKILLTNSEFNQGLQVTRVAIQKIYNWDGGKWSPEK